MGMPRPEIRPRMLADEASAGNPLEGRRGFPMITIKHDGCILCVGCSSVCPTNAIEVVGTRMEHFADKCIDCGLCVKICPSNVIQMYKGVKTAKDLPPDAEYG